jgi:RND family efflux transporter MFP subunit
VSGIATRLMVDVGDHVEKGDVIVGIDDQTIRDQLEELNTAYELAEDTYQKRKNLWDKQIGSQIEYLQAKNRKEALEKQINTLRSNLAKYTIRTPIAGKVDDVMINQGEMVSPGLPVANVVNASKVKVVADVSERYVGKIREGDSVEVYFPAVDLGRVATIHAVGQVINKENRTFKIIVRLSNDQHVLKPNLLAKINIFDYTRKDALVIPTRLVHFQQDSTYVFTANINDGDTVAQKVNVKLAYSSAEESLVDQGLAKGDLLIVEGHNRVSDGDKIKHVR